MSKNFTALTIAGSDTSGAAGLEADLKTFEEYGVYGMAAITVIVTMKVEDWSHEVYPIDLSLIEKQLATTAGGIKPNAVKTGMLGSAELVELVEKSIRQYDLKNVVIDPVMVCKGIDDIMIPDAAAATKKLLLQHADVITPNTVEAAYLADMDKLTNLDDLKEAAQRIHKQGAKNVIVKSGSRFECDSMFDVLFDGKEFTITEKPKHKNSFNSGAGCTFSAAITAGLAMGLDIKDAFCKAQDFIDIAVSNSFRLNDFHGALAPWQHHI